MILMAAMFFVHYLFCTNKVKPCILFSSIVCTRCYSNLQLYSYFRKVVGKNVHATILKGNMGYDQDAVTDTVAVKFDVKQATIPFRIVV